MTRYSRCHGHPLQPRKSPGMMNLHTIWTPSSEDWGVGMPQCNGFSTSKLLPTQVLCISHLISPFKSCGDEGGVKWQVEVNTGSHSPNPTQQVAWRSLVISHYDPGQQSSLATSQVTEHPFQDQHCSPSWMREGLERCPKHYLSQLNWLVYHDWQCTHTVDKKQ